MLTHAGVAAAELGLKICIVKSSVADACAQSSDSDAASALCSVADFGR